MRTSYPRIWCHVLWYVHHSRSLVHRLTTASSTHISLRALKGTGRRRRLAVVSDSVEASASSNTIVPSMVRGMCGDQPLQRPAPLPAAMGHVPPGTSALKGKETKSMSMKFFVSARRNLHPLMKYVRSQLVPHGEYWEPSRMQHVLPLQQMTYNCTFTTSNRFSSKTLQLVGHVGGFLYAVDKDLQVKMSSVNLSLTVVSCSRICHQRYDYRPPQYYCCTFSISNWDTF